MVVQLDLFLKRESKSKDSHNGLNLAMGDCTTNDVNSSCSSPCRMEEGAHAMPMGRTRSWIDPGQLGLLVFSVRAWTVAFFGRLFPYTILHWLPTGITATAS